MEKIKTVIHTGGERYTFFLTEEQKNEILDGVTEVSLGKTQTLTINFSIGKTLVFCRNAVLSSVILFDES